MDNYEIFSSEEQKHLTLIGLDGRAIMNVPEYIRKREGFVVAAIKSNSLAIIFLTDEEKNNDVIAFNIAFSIKNYADVIGEKLRDETFYEVFVKQKIKSKDTDNLYINKSFFSNKLKVLKLLDDVGVFSLNYLSKELCDDESLVYMFCKGNELNQLYASERILKEAGETGSAISNYLEKKLFYKILDEKFGNKDVEKIVKI